MKKLIRFILALIALPLWGAFWILSLIVVFIAEWLSDYPDWASYKEYHFKHLIKWYIFR